MNKQASPEDPAPAEGAIKDSPILWSKLSRHSYAHTPFTHAADHLGKPLTPLQTALDRLIVGHSLSYR